MSFNFYEDLKARAEAWSLEHPNCIPFASMPRFSEHISIYKGTYYLFTANSGVGKSRFVKHFFVHNVLDYVKKGRVKAKIIYFSLEEGIDRFYLQEICRQLYLRWGIDMDMRKLRSQGLKPLGNDILDKVKVIEKEDLPELEKYVTVLDVRNIHKMDKYMENIARSYGTIHHKDVNYGNDDVRQEFSHYTSDPDLYIIPIVDHVKLASGERTIKETIDKLSSVYVMRWRNRYGFTPVIVQQQVAGQEKKQFTNRGTLIESMEPSLEGLGEHKLTQQDADIVLGLFDPNRFSMRTYLGYDITSMRDSFRALKVLKHRDGLNDLNVGLRFDGAPGIFEELPKNN